MRKLFKRLVKLLLIFLLTISIVGFLLSIAFNIMSILGLDVSVYIVALIVLVIMVTVPSILVANITTANSKYYNDKDYGIKFWPAIKNSPKKMILGIYTTLIYVFVMFVSTYFFPDGGQKIITSTVSMFFYISLIIYLSQLKSNS